LEDTIRRDKCLYDQQKERLTFQKTWEDKNKFKVDQGKKGSKPPFFRNNPQGQPTSREPKVIEAVGQRPRKLPIQCWGCKGDHMYRYFPHRGEQLRTVHNVQQVETVEDMVLHPFCHLNEKNRDAYKPIWVS
jgi:hypothetical protein